MKKLLILLTLFLISCNNNTKILTKATYVIFYSASVTDTIHVATYGKIREDVNIIIDYQEEVGRFPMRIIYHNSAPYKRIYYKETVKQFKQ